MVTFCSSFHQRNVQIWLAAFLSLLPGAQQFQQCKFHNFSQCLKTAPVRVSFDYHTPIQLKMLAPSTIPRYITSGRKTVSPALLNSKCFLFRQQAFVPSYIPGPAFPHPSYPGITKLPLYSQCSLLIEFDSGVHD